METAPNARLVSSWARLAPLDRPDQELLEAGFSRRRVGAREPNSPSPHGRSAHTPGQFHLEHLLLQSFPQVRRRTSLLLSMSSPDATHPAALPELTLWIDRLSVRIRLRDFGAPVVGSE